MNSFKYLILLTFSIVLALFSPHWVKAGETLTFHNTNFKTTNDAGFRGFSLPETPGPIPFPKTSIPCCLQNSTQFGFGVPGGSSSRVINQNCDQLLFEATNRCVPSVSSQVSQDGVVLQSTAHGLLSRLQLDAPSCNGLGTGFRCNQIETQLTQIVPENSQSFSLKFSVISLTDPNGNLTGSAKGTFEQTINDPQATGGLTRTCKGAFTYDSVNGYALTAGPSAGCP